MNNWGEKVSFIWSIAELLRGPYRPNQYKDVMLPLTVLRRLDCVLEPTKEKVLSKYNQLKKSKIKNVEPILNRVAGQSFHNTSRFTFQKLKDDPENVAANLIHYIKSFSTQAREILDYFGFEKHIPKLEKSDRLYLLVQKFCEIDLHPDTVPNIEMGYIFEDLIRRFNEASNEEAGDHFTPREVIRLMVNLIFAPDNEILTTKGIVKTLYDPAAGTGGMLSVSENYLRELNPDARLEVFAQDYNEQAFAICGSDMLIKGHSLDNIRFGNSFTEDHFSKKCFDYMLANPPFGVEWKPEAKKIRKEHEEQGFGGRFGAGLPRITDGSLLFLQHMISKMKPNGSRLAIVFNGSPLFTGGAGSGESNIRKWIIENDWLEAIVGLPPDLFYNTGISTYIWILTNRKEKHRKGKIQLIDATSFFTKMQRNLGKKRNEISSNHIAQITRLYGDFNENEYVNIFNNTDFGYKRITVERPLRMNFAITDERIARVKETKPFQNLVKTKVRKNTKVAQMQIAEGEKVQRSILRSLELLQSHEITKNKKDFSAKLRKAFKLAGISLRAPLFNAILDSLAEKDPTADVCLDKKGEPEPDSELRDHENVPLDEEIDIFMEREVIPYYPDAWIDKTKITLGYEINFNRFFYKYSPPRPLEIIEKELDHIASEIIEKLAELRK